MESSKHMDKVLEHLVSARKHLIDARIGTGNNIAGYAMKFFEIAENALMECISVVAAIEAREKIDKAKENSDG